MLRINFFRALAGVPAAIVFNSTFSAKAQQAALMMSANNTLQHTGIPLSWTFYTAAGAEAAASSNLALGNFGPDAITAYMADEGSNNSAVGHRRWIIFPQTREMGTGDVTGNDANFNSANATWVIDSQVNAARPATRTPQVPYPPAGFVPYQLIWPRWSFAYPNADFSAATVTMTRAGQLVAVVLEPVTTLNEGERTLVWVYDGLNSSLATTHPKPTADTTYTVAVNNVRIAGIAQNFSYNVTVFDPDTAGSDFAPVVVTGPATPGVGVANPYSIAKPSFAAGFDWRTLQLSAFAKTYGAENGLDGLIATTTAGYNVVQSIAVGAGGASYRLTHPSPRTNQTLLLPETFFVNNASAAVTFLSRLGIATAIEVARLQISPDDGASWTDAFTQTGTSATNTTSPAPADAAFVSRSVSLAAYSGRTVRVRLAFTVEQSGVAFIPNATNTVGWFIDNLTLTGVQSVAAGTATSVASGANFSFTPASTGSLGLQARGVLFGAYPMEWGPVALVTAADNGGSVASVARITNLSILTSLTGAGDNFTLGYVVGNSSATSPLSLIIRAAGPGLGALGFPGTMADPKLETFAGSTKTGENDNWGGTATLKSAFASVGAFPFATDSSKDAATLGSITTRDNSVKVSAADNGAGAVIAEVYDATPAGNFSASTPRLINVSVLKPIGSGLTVGFVIGGAGSRTVLIRALGPTLATLFGLPAASVIADPKLELFDGASKSIGTNDNWGGTTALSAAFTAAGTFGFAANSLDAALTATLQSGNYTVVVGPSTGVTGTGLVEVYELP